MHGLISCTKGVIGEKMLEPLEAMIQDGDGAIDHSAPFEFGNVARMHAVRSVNALTRLRTRSVTRHTLSLVRFFLRGAAPDASPVVFQ